ncbi:hypothetical protein C8046_12695 [Serinibacter arcticus]|uniref:DUF559 domain-containing protein n=1 Tax=Serinibacter arcticus TaxID=1655435 RepID=A0A2U1ZWN6_9MICO|nr:hypothetical protein [Serinibacter arcticus]PWD51391.1 hypothetical protein C8046_12695 [Serinibacter arcticus]
MDHPQPDLINDGAPFLVSRAPTLGLDRYGVRRLVQTHRLRRVFRGVLVDASVPDSRELRVAALALVLPAHAIISDHSAAWVYGVDTYPPGALRELRPMCVVKHGTSRSHPSRAAMRQTTMPDPDVVTIAGLPVTSPLRTIADLLRLTWRPHALAAADALVRAGVARREDVMAYVGQIRGLRGTRQAQELAPLIDPRAQSHGESWMRLRMIDAGLPVPEVDHRIQHRGREYWLDAAYIAFRVAAEYDGREFHSDEADVQHDGARRARLSDELAWRFVIATFDRIFGDDDSFERELGELLGITVRPRTW